MEVKKLSPFDFINSINKGCSGENLLADCHADDSLENANPDSPDKNYVPFIINRGFSYFKDTVLFANEMNIKHQLPPKMQYDFYRNIVSNKKRFSKWAKKANASNDILAIQKYYNYSRQRAEEAYKILTKGQIQEIHKLLDKGGR